MIKYAKPIEGEVLSSLGGVLTVEITIYGTFKIGDVILTREQLRSLGHELIAAVDKDEREFGHLYRNP